MSRARVWTFITYPESLPKDYQTIIEEELTVPFVQSPLHDKDLLEGSTPEKNPFHPYKKPHYHNMLMFTNVKANKQVCDMVKKLGGTVATQVHSTQAMVRYFVHADQKNKAQYEKSEIKTYNGADLDNLFEKNDKEIYQIISDIIDFIEENTITELIDLMNYARKEMMSEWFPILTGKQSFIITKIVDSNRFKLEQLQKASRTEPEKV